MSPLRAITSRFTTIRALLAHFSRRGRFVLLPMLIVLLVGAVLLLATEGIAFLAPFVYSLF